MNHMKAIFQFLVFSLVPSLSSFAQGPFVPVQPQVLSAGIPAQMMNYFSASQSGSQWCWAASIEMVMRRYGVRLPQRAIVARTYGTDAFGQPPNWPGSWQAITANLNNWGLDALTGRPYMVTCQFGAGPPPPAVLVNELRGGFPVILAYSSGPNSGHAVVATAVRYFATPNGPGIVSVIVRDPFPTPQNRANLGRREYDAAQFAQVIQGYWLIRVQQ